MSGDKRRDDQDIELGEKNEKSFDAPPPPPQPRFIAAPSASLSNNPILPILSYCASSILMTVTNKYVLSGTDYNLNFLLLCVQVRIEPTLDDGDADRLSSVDSLRDCDTDVQIHRYHHISGFQSR